MDYFTSIAVCLLMHIWIQIMILLEVFCSVIYLTHCGIYKKAFIESDVLNLCFLWPDVRRICLYFLWLLEEGLLYCSLCRWLTNIKGLCLEVSRRPVWKCITAWFCSTEQLLLLGLIKFCPASKHCLTNTCSTGSP